MTAEQSTDNVRTVPNSSLFAKFKSSGARVPGKPGWLEREIAGDRYRVRLWDPLKALGISDMLLRRYGQAFTMALLAFVRYSVRRIDPDSGAEVVHVADVSNAESMFVHAAQALIDAAGEEHGILSLTLEYIPGEITRCVRGPGGAETWVDVIPAHPIADTVFDPSGRLLEDNRVTKAGVPIGYSTFYRGAKLWVLPALVTWVFAENLGGFTGVLLRSLPQDLHPTSNKKS